VLYVSITSVQVEHSPDIVLLPMPAVYVEDNLCDSTCTYS